MTRQDVKKNWILYTVFAASLLVSVYSILTYGQASIHSDTATATLLARSQWEHKSLFPETWNYVNGTIWTVGLEKLMLPLTYLIPDQSLARMLGSALFVLITVIAMVWASRTLLKSDMWLIAVPLFLVFLNGENDHILYLASYTGKMLWLSVNLTLAYLACYKDDRRAGVLYFMIIFILSSGGIAIFAERILPSILSILVLDMMEPGYDRKGIQETIKRACLMLAPALLGFIAYKRICSTHRVMTAINNMEDRVTDGTVFVSSLQECTDNLLVYIRNYFYCFKYSGNVRLMSVMGIQNVISITSCLAICFIIPFLQWRSLHNEERVVKFFVYFCGFHILAIAFMIIFMGLLAPRYVLSSIFLLLCISSRYIFANWLRSGFSVILQFAFAAAVAVECLALLMQGIGWKEELASRKGFNQELMDRGLEKGYASYWHAYSNQIYSDMKIQYGGIEFEDGNIYKYDWLVDEDVFSPEDTNTFLLLEPYEEQILSFDIEERFGTVIDKFDLDGYSIYVFDHDIAADFYQKDEYDKF